MGVVTCVKESVYSAALTRGETYEVTEVDQAKHQVRLRGESGRTRWFPMHCFVEGSIKVPVLAGFSVDDPLDGRSQGLVEVTVELTGGQKRWCLVATPKGLVSSGEELEGGVAEFHAPNHHLLIISSLTVGTIGALLRHLDSQGELEACTLPLE